MSQPDRYLVNNYPKAAARSSYNGERATLLTPLHRASFRHPDERVELTSHTRHILFDEAFDAITTPKGREFALVRLICRIVGQNGH